MGAWPDWHWSVEDDDMMFSALPRFLGICSKRKVVIYLSLSPARAPAELISAPCFTQEGASPLSSRQHLFPSQFGFFARREEPRIINDSMMKQPHSSLLFTLYIVGLVGSSCLESSYTSLYSLLCLSQLVHGGAEHTQVLPPPCSTVQLIVISVSELRALVMAWSIT